MTSHLKRNWSSTLNEEEQQRNDFWYEQKKRLRGFKKSFSGPLSNRNVGLETPPTTPEKKGKTTSRDLYSHDKVVRRLRFTEESYSPYNEAKKAFLRGSAADLSNQHYLPGRQREAKALEKFIIDALHKIQSTSIYISGPPGTGKTAQVNAILQSLTEADIQNKDPASRIYNMDFAYNECSEKRTVRLIKINCMTLRTPEDIFKKMDDTCDIHHANGSIQQKEYVKRSLGKSSKYDMTILILDEMDSVINKYQQTLFELFSWASQLHASSESVEKPRLVLIGIANALDLTDRFLPRLRSNRINPKLVQFLPYTASQIRDIITTKLYNLDSNITTQGDNRAGLPPIIHPSAILFCAKKAAVSTGDLRKAFDIIHRSIEVTEEMTMKRLSEDKFKSLTIKTAPKVMIAQVAKVCTSAFNTDYQQKLSALNFQSKTLLCCLFKFEEKRKGDGTEPVAKKSSKADLSIHTFFEFYNKFLKSVDRMISTLRRGEFLEILSTLESNSLVNLSLLSDNSAKFVSGNPISRGASSPFKHMITFGNYKISSNIPREEFMKSIRSIELLMKLMECHQ